MNADELDDFVKHEAFDRTSIAINVVEDLLGSHPYIEETPSLKAKVDEVQSILMGIYQELGYDKSIES